MTASPRGHWVLQLDPMRSDVQARRRRGGQSDFCVRRHLRRLRIGDDAVLWVSGRGVGSGAVALGTVTGGVFPDAEAEAGRPGWAPGALPATAAAKVPVRFDRWLETPLPRLMLKTLPAFAGSAIIRRPFAGNPLPLTNQEWQVLLRAAEDDRGRLMPPRPAGPPRCPS